MCALKDSLKANKVNKPQKYVLQQFVYKYMTQIIEGYS